MSAHTTRVRNFTGAGQRNHRAECCDCTWLASQSDWESREVAA